MATVSESLYITQIRFCRALAIVRSLPTESGGLFQPSIKDKLNFYGLYKQALAGDCMMLRPSSRHVVQYAKWKAWDKMRGKSPIDAQIMYINALVGLLREYLQSYPSSELTESLTESLNYLLEVNDTAADEESLVHWDTNEQERDEYYLGQIEKDQLEQHNNSSYYSSPITAGEFPMTPELSPRSRNTMYNTKEFDIEVATATSSLYLATPTQHPYQKSVYKRPRRRSNNNSRRPSESAIQTLQTEVAALCEEIDSLRQRNKSKYKSLFQWRWLWLLRSVAKQAFFNFIILLLVFLVLWRRKSPIAYAVVSYAGPRLRDFIQYLFSHIIFWKVTV